MRTATTSTPRPLFFVLFLLAAVGASAAPANLTPDWLVRQPVVRDGQARTDTLDRIWPPDDWAARTVIPDAAWAAAATLLLERGEPADPWAGGWRLNARPAVRLEASRRQRAGCFAPWCS